MTSAVSKSRLGGYLPASAGLLLVALALAGCVMGRGQVARTATPPDPPPVPRAKPIAPATWGGTVTQYPETQYPETQYPELAQPAPSTGQQVHVITEGQSLYAVARLYDVSTANLIQANQLSPPYKLALGQRLLVPTAPGLRLSGYSPAPAAAAPAPAEAHLVKPGDTVYSIARRYQVDMETLVHMNGIPASYFISPGQRLKLPGRRDTGTALAGLPATGAAKLSSAAATATPQPQPVAQATGVSWTQSTQSTVAMVPPPEVTGPIPKAPPRAGDKFLWPVEGKLLVNYGPKQGGLHNDGINIAAPRGSPVMAAENGVVAYVGNELRGFGNLLLIKHDGGWMTAYAHNEAILVGRGAKVKRGQTVARVGESGSVVTPQLHFEIRRGTRAVDPAKLLGPRQAAQM